MHWRENRYLIQKKLDLNPQYPNYLYSFDSSAFIEPWRRHYPIDIPIFTPIWDKIKILIQEKKIIASIIVKKELERKDDELYNFLNQFPNLFLQPSKEEQKIVENLIKNPDFDKWGTSQKHNADPFVVAMARVHKLKVVTFEKPTKTKNSIPAACNLLNVICISFVEFLREQDFPII